MAGGGILLSPSIEHSTSTNGGGAIGDGDGDFTTFAGRFTATGATTRLSLTSTSASNSASGGVLLDAVAIVPGFAADFDIDGDVDQDDYGVWAAAHGAIALGDANGDNLSNAADYTVWRDTLGSTTSLAADGSGNGVVDAVDRALWAANYGAAAASSATAVPEPAGGFVMGVFVLLFQCRQAASGRR